MTTPTPRTDATCKAIVAMLEPLRGGTRVTDAEMKAVQGVIDGLAKCATDLERNLAAAQAELAQERERAEAAEKWAELLLSLIETVMAIPAMSDEQLAELQRNCRAAIAGEK